MLQSRRAANANSFAGRGCTYRRGDFPAEQVVGPKVEAAIVSAVAINWIMTQLRSDQAAVSLTAFAVRMRRYAGQCGPRSSVGAIGNLNRSSTILEHPALPKRFQGGRFFRLLPPPASRKAPVCGDFSQADAVGLRE
jgi:hypothetical protein